MKNLLVLTAFLIGCGGDGVSDSKKLSDLSTAEAVDVCKELAADYPKRTVTCGNFTYTIGFSGENCDGETPAPGTCTATVGDVRACNDAIYSQTDEQLCMDSPPPAACAKLENCGDAQ